MEEIKELSKSSQYVKTYYQKHPEQHYKRLEYNKKYIANQLAVNKEAYLEKRRLINRNNYTKNKDRINELCRLRYAKKKEKICEKERKKYHKREISYYQENREKILERLKKRYHEKNPNAKYRNKKEITLGKFGKGIIEKKISKVLSSKKGKTKLKQRVIDNNLKKIKQKAEQFKNELTKD